MCVCVLLHLNFKVVGLDRIKVRKKKDRLPF
jgi:hypothetical protein